MGTIIGKHKALFLVILLADAILLPLHLQAMIIKAEQIKMVISHHIEQNMPWPPGSMRINFISKIADIVLPQESIAFEVQNKSEEDFIGDSDFTLKYLVERKVIKEEKVRVRLEVLKDVVIAARALAKDKEITSDDLQIHKKWMKRIPENMVTAPEEVIGKALKVNVRPNIELTSNMIKSPLMIKKGRVVRIIFNNDNLSITAIGVSEEDGAADSMIRVKNVASNKTIYAKVAGESLVRVEF